MRSDKGVVPTTSLSFSIAPSQQDFSRPIFVKNEWIAKGIKNILWLPPEYRPIWTVIYEKFIALGLISGRVFSLVFSKFP